MTKKDRVIMDKKVSKSLSFQLKAIDLLSIGLNPPSKPIGPEVTFAFNFDIEHRLNLENNIIVVICSIEILEESERISIGNLSTRFTYELKDLDDFIDGETKKVSFPDDFIFNLNTISLSTVRGIMYSNFKGTFLHNAYLPIIDTKGLKPNK